ncbi:hypothetical protein [Microbacterium trichothecenolyticum]|uniref:DUF916 domain-containing protein n=1 Tax=Microbacterium trichothecenolyticum TaxID=69370 RepID=A0ABU0TV93_MICTR|nr:hypothetical protein [Microbacterium trichothecenolyticum]MDQ1123569.1 hypothetical protein [Microbacterium trichothecenolyticum]
MFTARFLVQGTVAFAAAVALVALGDPAAHAASDSDITWSVTPADATGPDNRGVIQQELDPGASREDFFAVHNLSRTEVTFALSAADGYYTGAGRFNMLPADRESVDAGRWIDLPRSVTVAPNATVVVPFTTTVPDGAIPGDHAAGIAASVASTGTDAGGSKVGVESRVGFRVMTRVTGEIVPSFAVTGVGTDYDMSWNPFRPGSAHASFTVENTGNASLLVAGTAAIGTGSTTFPDDGAPRQELLPGESRSFTVAIDGVWPTFFAPGSVDVVPAARDLGGAAVEVAPRSTATSLWAVPLPQLLVLLGLVLIVVALFWRRRRFTAALDRAREEGRLAAGVDRAGPAATGVAGDDAADLSAPGGSGRLRAHSRSSGTVSLERHQ